VALRPIFSDGLPLSDTTYFGNYMVILKKIKRCLSFIETAQNMNNENNIFPQFGTKVA